jgi:eukaryotic-like serine/threonine-protein kinase
MTGSCQCPQCGSLLATDGTCVACLMHLAIHPTVATAAGETSAARGASGLPQDRTPTPVEHPGDRFGVYTLIAKLGEGGMGRVWSAEQSFPIRRTVALKVIRPGLDSEQVLGRFEAERQALARMDHPNIAKVLDAGTAGSGRPYFVMEWVKGPPITRFAAERQLPIQERLQLFAGVCRAIQHAHQKGVLHRDIKPSNVLVSEVDGRSVPKVIDFGVAKALGQSLTEGTLFTQFGVLVGTPEYMSPEQASMDGTDMDTRSDVYSLGVLLYELLTGRTPIDRSQLSGAGFEEILRRIREEDPDLPSVAVTRAENASVRPVSGIRTSSRELLGALRGDLDWVIMKSLEKDRSRRYGSAQELLADVERFLNGEPVTARPPSGLYRVGKLIRRHRVAVVASGAVLISLIVGFATSTVALVREREARERAVISEQNNKQFAEFLLPMLEGVGPAAARGRDTTLLREVLDATDRRLQSERFTHPEVEANLNLMLARVYHDLALYAAAERSASRALDLLQPRNDQRKGNELRVTPAMLEQARARLGRGDYPGAEAVARECLHLRRRVLGDDHLDVAAARGVLGEILLYRDRPREAEAEFHRAVTAYAQDGRTNTVRWADLQGKLAAAIHAQGEKRYADAAPVYRSALGLTEQLLGKHPQTARLLHQLAELLDDQSQLAESELLARRAVDLRSELLGTHHPEVANSLYLLSDALLKQGKFGEAELCVDPFLPEGGLDRPDCVHLLRTRARVLARRGQFQAASDDYWRVLHLEPENHWHYLQVAPLFAGIDDWERYRRLRGQALERFRDTADIAVAERMTKACLLEPEAVLEWEILDRWTAFAMEQGADHQFLPYFQLARGLFQLRRGNWAAAADLAERVLANTGPSEAGLRDVQALMLLAQARHHLGEQDEALNTLEAGKESLSVIHPSLSGDLLSSWHETLYARILTRETEELIR